jgi:hypothetical protein
VQPSHSASVIVAPAALALLEVALGQRNPLARKRQEDAYFANLQAKDALTLQPTIHLDGRRKANFA